MLAAPIARHRPLARAAHGAMVAVCLAVWLLPLGGVLLTSLHSVDDLSRGNVWSWPAQLQWSNYAIVLGASRMSRFIVNSFLVTIPVVAATVLISSMAGFALAKHAFPGSRLLLMIFVAGNLVPFQVLMIPVRDLVIALRLYDTRWALILFHTAFQTGFCTLLMPNFIPDLRGPGGRCRGAQAFLACGAAARAPGDGGGVGIGVHVRLERLFLVAGARAIGRGPPGHGRSAVVARDVAEAEQPP